MDAANLVVELLRPLPTLREVPRGARAPLAGLTAELHNAAAAAPANSSEAERAWALLLLHHRQLLRALLLLHHRQLLERTAAEAAPHLPRAQSCSLLSWSCGLGRLTNLTRLRLPAATGRVAAAADDAALATFTKLASLGGPTPPQEK